MSEAGARDREAARAALASELEALGEATPSSEELDALLDENDGDDVAFVGRLVDVAELGPDAQRLEPRLDEMGARRAWTKVEARVAGVGAGDAVASPGRRPSWVPVVLGVVALAAAMALALIVVPRGENGPGTQIAVGDAGEAEANPAVDPAEVEALSEQARAGLSALGVDGHSASKRAREMRADFRAALESEGAG